MRVSILGKLEIYNPAIARFLSVDPLTSSYPHLTPYAFAENDVIRSIDLDGLEKLALSGTVPISQYSKYRNGEYLGPTHYEANHIMTFIAQAQRLSKLYGFATQQVSSGDDILKALVSTTKTYGYVSRLAFFGHTGPSGFYLKKDEGFYYSNKSVPENAGLGAKTIEDLKALINSGDVKFSKDAICVIDGCTTAGVEEPQAGIAFQIALTTGMSVIASTGKVKMTDEKNPNGRLTTDGYFYLFVRKGKMVDNPDKAWYHFWKPDKIESQKEFEVTAKPIGDSINIDEIIK